MRMLKSVAAVAAAMLLAASAQAQAPERKEVKLGVGGANSLYYLPLALTEKLGFFKVAPYYMYPGFWEGGPAIHLFTNLEKWNSLPPAYQTIVANAAAYANSDMMAKYDALNPGALRELIGGGAKLKPFPADVIDAAYTAAHEVYDEISAENADFKTIFESVKAFRNEGYLWNQVAEYTYDTFMIRNRTKG